MTGMVATVAGSGDIGIMKERGTWTTGTERGTGTGNEAGDEIIMIVMIEVHGGPMIVEVKGISTEALCPDVSSTGDTLN